MTTTEAAMPDSRRMQLQRRELLRTAYSGTTLRENLHLPRPPSQFTSQVQTHRRIGGDNDE